MSNAQGRYDELFATLAHQNGSIDSLLDSFFEFLNRKTDFYVVTNDPAGNGMGFRPGHAQQRVLSAFQKYPFRDIDTASRRPLAAPEVAASSSKSQPQATRVADPPRSERAPPRLTEAGKQFPVGNGGSTKQYTWTQTLEDVTIQFDLPVGTNARDINCQIKANHLCVAIRRTPEPIVLVDSELPEKIRVDESVWSLENNRTLHVSLEKIKQTWWASAVVGGEEIDTSQVDSTRQIHEYDDATQGAIRKAMFDQQQRQQGLPTTEEVDMERVIAQASSLPGSPL